MNDAPQPDKRTLIAPYALFIWAAFAMLSFGSMLQYFLPLQWGLLITEFVVVLGVAALARWFFGVADLGASWRSMKVWDVSPAALLLLVVAAPILGIFANLVAALGPEFIPALKDLAEAYESMLDQIFPRDNPLLFAAGVVSVVIAAPLCEEFLFRGTILPLQERAHRRIWLIVLTNGVMFGAIHFNPLSLVALSIVGAFLADISMRTKSLWPAVIGHAVLNFCNGLVLPFVAEAYGDPHQEATLTEIGTGLLFITPLAAACWWGLRRLMPRHDGDAVGSPLSATRTGP